MHASVRNRLWDAMSDADRGLLAAHAREVALQRNEVLFEPGEDVTNVCFPGAGVVVTLIVTMQDGATSETAIIGQEGAVGGVISAGDKPAFTRAVVQLSGKALQLPVEALEEAKTASPTLRDHMARYADCLLAQVLQAVACAAVHPVEARLAGLLLALQDRIGAFELAVTQDMLADMLGVQRPYLTKLIGVAENTGAIRLKRGAVTVLARAQLEEQACECYGDLRRHFERVLPGVYPTAV